jgi:hypothetical protein
LRGVRFADLGGLLLGADGGHDAVVFGEELLQDVGWGLSVGVRVWQRMFIGRECRGLLSGQNRHHHPDPERV